ESKPSQQLLQTAIEALTCMTHRGGINADGKTGDGCGLLLQKPDAFFHKVAKELGVTLPASYAPGMVFVNPDPVKAAAQKAVLDEELRAEGLEVLGWRDVPTDPSCLGPIALNTLPAFAQVLVGGGQLSNADLNRKLFFARRRTENRIENDGCFYVCSLSATVIA